MGVGCAHGYVMEVWIFWKVCHCGCGCGVCDGGILEGVSLWVWDVGYVMEVFWKVCYCG